MSTPESFSCSTPVADPLAATSQAGPSPSVSFRPSKILDRHRAQLAIVYVRQSSPQQVLEHRESRERQYDLVEHAVGLGWPKERILLIDEDQGQSGTTAQTRTGFQRMVAEVTMNHVGLVLALEVSRLTRSGGDWYQLSELCTIFGTLLGDQEGIYDPDDPNDRLILGLKGMMSEVELLTMRNRLERGRLHKAERGELFTGGVPLGYLKHLHGPVEKDPDEQVQTVVNLVFDLFDELGTAWAVFHYLVRHNLRLGYRIQRGGRRGELEWRRPNPCAVRSILTHPIYAGVYAYGRRPTDPRRRLTGRSRWDGPRLPPSQWKVLKRDHLPAYITWERYLANQQRLQDNRNTAQTPGVPRPGEALLTGLIVCGSCGRRLSVSYPRKTAGYYHCRQHFERGVEPNCHGLRAEVVDRLVSQEVLQALQPAALELSLQAIADIQQERTRLDRHWHQQLQRARYEAEQAERRYRAVEPENRLVARTLEQRWEEALQQEAELKEEYDRFKAQQPAQLHEADREAIQALAQDIPALWEAPETTMADRKTIVRSVLERVVVQVRPDSEHVAVTIDWQGGFISRHESVRSVSRYDQLQDYEQLLSRITALRGQCENAAELAQRLNDEGYRTPRRRGPFSAEGVRQLLSRAGLASKKNVKDLLGEHEWQVPELARELGVNGMKLRAWARRGWLLGRQVEKGVWVAWADQEELQRLRALAANSRRGITAHSKDLTTPNKQEKG